MHVQTHIMSGWCLGNCMGLSGRQRLMCMLAGSLADADGFGAAVSQEWFWDYHHKLGHGIVAGLMIAIGLALLSRQRMKMGVIYLGLFHLHLVMDYFGSGQGWEIYYLWPMSNRGFASRHVWDFYSWQNLTAAGVLLGWTAGIIRYAGRTPLEVIMPSLDRQIVEWAGRSSVCGGEENGKGY